MGSDPSERCHMARILSAMFKDPTNHLYLTFLKPVLEEVNRANLLQSEIAEVTELCEELRILLMFVARKIMKPTYLTVPAAGVLRPEDLRVIENALNNESALLPVTLVDFGQAFNAEVATLGAKVTPQSLATV